MSAKVQKKFAKRIGGSGGATNGLSSTVAFTPLQVCPSHCTIVALRCHGRLYQLFSYEFFMLKIGTDNCEYFVRLSKVYESSLL